MKTSKYNKIKKIFINIIFASSLLLFFISFNFQDNVFNGWSLQVLPVGNQINDVKFLDSLTGFAVTNVNSNISYILKTTNAGNNWVINKTNTNPFTKIIFLNKNVGYSASWDTLFKTTNSGENWNSIPIGNFGFWILDMSVLNEDTIWAVDNNGLVGGVFRTTNGGQNWIQQFYQFNNNPDKIYMVNKNLGFMRKGSPPFSSYVGRTTNGGLNWVLTPEDSAFTDVHFIDSVTGWMAGGNLKKTTDGGLTWIYQILPHGNNFLSNGISRFSFINKDTIFGVGGVIYYPYPKWRGIIYKTINGGINWGYQIPDSGFGITLFGFVNFTDKRNGWAFSFNTKLIHTTTGGSDTTFFTDIKNQNISLVNNFYLKQNYPNPFNSKSNIKYEISKMSFVEIKIFDIRGKEIEILVGKRQNEGSYEIKFDASNLPSGIYFYSLFINGKIIDTKKALLIK